MIVFKVDGKPVKTIEVLQVVPQMGEKVNFEQNQEGIYRVKEVEHDYSKIDVQITIHLQYFKD